MTVARADAPDSGLRRSAFWVTVMDSGGQVINLAVSIVLAALLGPEAFGLVAMALVFVMFVQLLQQQGMQAAVIQRKDLDGKHQDAAFWMVVAVSLLTTAACLLLADWWAAVNRQPELAAVLMALSAILPIRALATVQEATARRGMRFRPLAARSLSAALVGGAVGIGGALGGWGVWALVAQQLTTAFVSVVLLWAVSTWRPRLRFSPSAARDLLGFSSGSFLTSLGVFVNNRADALLIGLFFGPVVVGVYRLGAKLVESALAIAVRPAQSLALPELARHQDDPGRFRHSLLRLTSMSGWLALPALGVLAGGAGVLVELLGPEWTSAEAVLRILCLVGVVRVLVAMDGPALLARGMVFLQAGATWFTALVSAGALLVAAVALRGEPVAVQAAGVAATRALVYGGAVLAVHVPLLRRAAGGGVWGITRALGPGLGAGLGSALALGSVDASLEAAGASLLWRAVACGVVGVVLVGAVGRKEAGEVIRSRRPPATGAAGASTPGLAADRVAP